MTQATLAEGNVPNLDPLIRIASLASGCPAVFIALLENEQLVIRAASGLGRLTQIPRAAAFCKQPLLHGRFVEIPELDSPVSGSESLPEALTAWACFAGAPLFIDGNPIGVIGVLDRSPRRLSNGQKDILLEVAAEASCRLQLVHDQQVQQSIAATVINDLGHREAEQRFLIDHLMAGVAVHDPQGALLRANPRACQLLRLTEDQMRGKQLIDPAWNFLRDDGSPMPVEEYPVSRVLRTAASVRGVVVGVTDHTSPDITWLIGNGDPQLDKNGHIERVVVTFVDITPLKELEVRLQRSERRYRALFENAMDGIVLGSPDGLVLEANPAACEIYGMSQEELRSAGRGTVVDEDNQSFLDFHSSRTLNGRARGELEMRRASGERFVAEVSSTVFEDQPGHALTSVIIRDITDRKRSEGEIRRLAYFDDLTSLPNRRYLSDKLRNAMAAATRLGHVGALCFVDLDNFKHVNDARGHLVGDRLLQMVSKRLLECLRGEDTLARIGGDEFIVLLEDIGPDTSTGARNAVLVADKIRKALEAPYEIDGQPYSSMGSIGITMFPREAQDVDDVIREADTAMYKAKVAGRNRVVFYESSMQQEIEQRLGLEQDLIAAVRKGELMAYAQPQFAADGTQVGGEILLRWQHSQRGFISPAEFIPIAEQGGLIHEIGEWVLLQACEALVELGNLAPTFRISVNVSPRQFLHEDFIEVVQRALQDTGAAAAQLVFEVTESLLIHNWDEVSSRFLELAALGIRFSIDDFGTGYSSLAYLKKIPLFELKIDRSFVAAVPNDSNDVAIVESIIAIAKHLKLKVVAEGVETPSQVDFLVAAECDCLQGYYFAKPMPLATWIRALNAAVAG